MITESREIILASQSPRRRDLLTEAGYQFVVDVPHESAECGICSQETPPELVARLAYQKAENVARRHERGLILGCDTVAECCGQTLGKPHDERHAREMLELLRGREHRVYSGVCLWRRPGDERLVDVDVTVLQMDEISDDDLAAYLASHAWEGKAGAFGYQDRHDWIRITKGSESNVVGLPLELLKQMLQKFEHGQSGGPDSP